MVADFGNANEKTSLNGIVLSLDQQKLCDEIDDRSGALDCLVSLNDSARAAR
jgi:hypothetical protein